MTPRDRLVGLGLGVTAVILFGGSLPMTRLAVLSLDPWFVTAARAAIAGVVAAAVLLIMRRPIPWRDLPRLAAIAFCLVIAFPGLMAMAMTTVPSNHGAVILALLPMATAVAAVFLAGERPSPFFWAMSFLGSALVVAFALRGDGYLPDAGDLYLLAGVAVCGTGYALSGSLSRRMAGWEVISWAVTASLCVSIPATLLTWPSTALSSVPWPAGGGLLYVALISQYFGFWLWNTALAAGGVARVGQVQHLQTFATLILSALLLGETVGLRTIGFAVAVVAVVVFGVRARVRTPGPTHDTDGLKTSAG